MKLFYAVIKFPKFESYLKSSPANVLDQNSMFQCIRCYRNICNKCINSSDYIYNFLF